jgi:dihydropteroate synthase
VIPVIELLRRETDSIVSIDTSKPGIMRAAVSAGADFINDVCALQKDDALSVAAELDTPVCLMHMQGEPRSMQESPHYGDVVQEVYAFLEQRAMAAINAGIKKQHIILDPGFGFGKNLQQNLTLIKQFTRFQALGYPLLVGVSRKSSIGTILDKPVTERVIGSVVMAALLVQSGASIVRVHDVAATLDMIKILQAVEQA